MLENTEFFHLNLERNGLHERIQLDRVDGIVEITDNDGMCTVVIARLQHATLIRESTIVFNFFSSEAVVGLEDTFYRVSEGVGFVEVCAIVYHPVFECPIDFAYDVDFSAVQVRMILWVF